MASLVLSLPEIRPEDLPETGGKAAGLARLAFLGLPVPPAFAVTASFFEEVRSFFPDEPESDSLARRLPAPLMAAVESGLEGLGAAPHGYAVRSSAPWEDGEAESFAGVHESCLGVERQGIPSALFKCWASAFSQRAISYRRRLGLPAESSAIRMGVVVQVMLNPSVAGVLFTREPGTAGESMLIEAARGAGEDLAQGRIQPVSIRLARDGGLSSAGSPARSPLPEGALRALADMALTAEADWGFPLDLEWAMEGERIFLLQARPIRGARGSEGGAGREISSPDDSLWSRANLRELLPELPSVFLSSLLERFDWSRLLRDAGVPAPPDGTILRVIQGRPYFNLSLLGSVLEELGLSPSGFARVFGPGSEVPGRAGGEDRPLRALLLHPLRHLKWRRRQARAPGQALVFFDRVHERTRALKQADPACLGEAELLGRIREMERHNQEFLVQLVSGFSRAAAKMLAVEALFPSRESPDGFVSAVLGAGEGNVSVRQGVDLLRLGKLARREGRVVQYLVEGKRGYRDYEQELEGTRFLPAFREYLAEYGHRGVQETDPATPTYAEDPGFLLRAVSVAAADPLSPDPETVGWRHQERVAVAAWKGLRRSLPWFERLVPLRVVLLREAVSGLGAATALRERIRFEGARVNAELRRFLRETGKRLRDRGLIQEAEDLFMLRVEEIEAALSGKGGGTDLLEAVRRRREERRRQERIPAPDFLRESEIPGLEARAPLEFLEEGTFQGLPVGPGRVEGRAVVLEGPHQVDRVRRGDILVAPTLDPSWIPLLTLASGLVVEVGGTLSHGSILAREYGLPTVANLPGITRKLRSGQRILVDGSAGVVRRLEG